MIALVTDQGTAAAETALCANHQSEYDKAHAQDQADNDVLLDSWANASTNPELECIMCGARSCYSCGHDIPGEATLCPNCGADQSRP